MVFDDVVVEPDEVLPRSHKEPFVSFAPFYAASGALAFGAVYLGAAIGALEQAKKFTLTLSRPRPGSGVGSASQDPFILADYGDLWIKTQAALAYLDDAAGEFDSVFARRREMSEEDLSALNAHTNAFRLYAGQIGIEIGSRIYDVTGASATANKYGFDRFWRDVRIHSLHVHPPVYGHRGLGDYFVNGTPQHNAPFYHD
jgi:alkylation response protein AidB-like acyl-CoA dehydrogenase